MTALTELNVHHKEAAIIGCVSRTCSEMEILPCT